MDPIGLDRDACANKRPAGWIVNPTTGKCEEEHTAAPNPANIATTTIAANHVMTTQESAPIHPKNVRQVDHAFAVLALAILFGVVFAVMVGNHKRRKLSAAGEDSSSDCALLEDDELQRASAVVPTEIWHRMLNFTDPPAGSSEMGQHSAESWFGRAPAQAQAQMGEIVPLPSMVTGSATVPPVLSTASWRSMTGNLAGPVGANDTMHEHMSWIDKFPVKTEFESADGQGFVLRASNAHVGGFTTETPRTLDTIAGNHDDGVACSDLSNAAQSSEVHDVVLGPGFETNDKHASIDELLELFGPTQGIPNEGIVWATTVVGAGTCPSTQLQSPYEEKSQAMAMPNQLHYFNKEPKREQSPSPSPSPPPPPPPPTIYLTQTRLDELQDTMHMNAPRVHSLTSITTSPTPSDGSDDALSADSSSTPFAADGSWSRWALLLSAKDRNRLIKVHSLTTPEITDLKSKSRRMKQTLSQKSYYQRQQLLVSGEFLQKHDATGLCPASEKVCAHPGCNTTVFARGLCSKHGGKSVCTHPGCNTRTQSRGLCCKHGGGSQAACLYPGCTTKAESRGLCCKHGGGVTEVCRLEGCTTIARANRLCFKHGAYGICIEEDCTNKAVTQQQLCRKHKDAFSVPPTPPKDFATSDC
jgi:hypothetical protein